MSTDNSAVFKERRDRQRVVDAIGLEVRKLTELPAAGEPRELPARSATRVANKYDIAGYAEVKSSFPAVAGYIDSLEERIRQLLLDGDVSSVVPTHKVSLSASGMAFADSQLLQPGEMVNLQLTLFPGQIKINCDGTVVSVGDVGELAVGDQHTYRIAFSRITVHDRNLIEGHVRRLRKSLRQDIRNAE